MQGSNITKVDSYASNGWYLIFYNGAYKWYYFSINGIMSEGWIQDVDGLIYYVEPDKEGERGRLLYGNKEIDGMNYSLNRKDINVYTKLLEGATDPEGFIIDISNLNAR